MELGGSPILSRIVGPDGSAGLFIEGAEKSVARTDENQISRNCGSGEDSAAGRKLPNDTRVLSRFLKRGRKSAHRRRGK